MASRLYLLRHAKAGWALPGMRDFDRPLEASGIADAEATGQAMRSAGFVPDVTLCSAAVRCRQTLEAVALQADTGRVQFLETLYADDASGYLATIRNQSSAGSLLVIGHNPMIEDLAIALAGEGDRMALAALELGFPTSGLAVLRFDAELARTEPGAGYLENFLAPSGP
jgi:phosphohistidine phosphatase